MRAIAVFIWFLTSIGGFASSASALDKGFYVITENLFIAERAQIDALRNTPLFGDIVRQLEASGVDAHAVFDPETSLMTLSGPARKSLRGWMWKR